jgi:hypothetical protein
MTGNRLTSIRPTFVEFIPSDLDEGVLYVSMEYATVVHLCCCGCGNQVVTPLKPNRWSLTFDGVALSLWPSVGNWSFPCQSHYWIRENEVEWARRWSPREIDVARTQRRTPGRDDQLGVEAVTESASPPGFWGRLKWRFFR